MVEIEGSDSNAEWLMWLGRKGSFSFEECVLQSHEEIQNGYVCTLAKSGVDEKGDTHYSKKK